VVRPHRPRTGRERQNVGVRHETAVRRLRRVAERCQWVGGLGEDRSLLGAYAFGAVLDSRADLPVVQMAFVLDLPAEELTWGARPQSCVGLMHLLEIDKSPVAWDLRPAAWPVTNHAIRRPLQVWSLDGGPDVAALDALARGDAEALRLSEPAPADLRDQLAAELAASRNHLRVVEAAYWERDWRFAHRGLGVYPEHHLWDAVHGYLDLLDASGAAGPSHDHRIPGPADEAR
jgi:hypothetical protein